MQTPEARQLSELERDICYGNVIKMEQVEYGDAPCYIVLRKNGTEFCTHFYNSDRDAFEFGTYHRTAQTANIKYHARLAEYGILKF